MKTEIELTLFKNDKNISKKEVLSAFEILMDDEDNPLPEEWFSFWNGNAGLDIPWNSKVNVTIESVFKNIPLKFNFIISLNKTNDNLSKIDKYGAFEIMLYDKTNLLPEEFINFTSLEAGDDIPWNSKTKIILKLIID